MSGPSIYLIININVNRRTGKPSRFWIDLFTAIVLYNEKLNEFDYFRSS